MSDEYNPDEYLEDTPPPPPGNGGKWKGQYDLLAARPLPASSEAERGLLTLVVGMPLKIELLRNRLTPEAFHWESHQIVYASLLAMFERGDPITLDTLSIDLSRRAVINRVGGVGGLYEIIQPMQYSDSMWGYYLKRVQDLHIIRLNMRAAAEMIEGGYLVGAEGANEDVTDYVRECEAKQYGCSEALQALAPEGSRRDWRTQQEVLEDVVNEFERVLISQGAIQANRVPSGFTDLDRMTGGGKGGQLLIVAGRPAMGKTSKAMNIAHNAAIGPSAMHYVDGLKNITPKTGAIVSAEMPSEEILMREYVGGAGVDVTVVRMGVGLRREQHDDLKRRFQQLSAANLHWLDVAGISIQELRSKLRALKQRLIAEGGDLHFCVVDYLQLLKSATARAKGNREIEIAEISAGLKECAKELNIYMIVLAQLNRKAEERVNGEPELADLRESGSIEQDADQVALLWRPHYYNPQADPGMAVLKLAKHRGGPVGSILLEWEAKKTQFRSTCNHLHSNNPAEQQKSIPDIPKKGSKSWTEGKDAGDGQMTTHQLAGKKPYRKQRSDHGDDWAEGLSGDDD
jgi:replicative DNA helicase